MKYAIATILVCICVAQSSVASADELETYDVDWNRDGTWLGLSLIGTLLVMEIPVRHKESIGISPISIDEPIKKYFSPTAASRSDLLIATTIALPLIHQVRSFDKKAGQRALLYGETLGTGLILNNLVKYLVQRPRPYTYNPNSSVRNYAKEEGDDAFLSFYSGHASMAASAASAGSILFASEVESEAARMAFWATEMGLATATAVLRVRAGKHFSSDVALGFAVGFGVGFAVPALHSDSGLYSPSELEWGAIVGGMTIGGLVAGLVDIDDSDNISENLGSAQKSRFQQLRVAPQMVRSGAGLALTGLF